MRHKWILLFVGLLIAACTAPMRGMVLRDRSPEPTVEITVLPSISPVPTLAPTPSPIASSVPSATALPTPEVSARAEILVPQPEPLLDMNLYREGAFIRQQTNYWCVSASVQIMINMIKTADPVDVTKETQKAISKIAWGNVAYKEYDGVTFKQSRYGSDPQGWVAALEKFGGGDYEWVNSKSFNAAVKSAVKAMAVTGRPVGLVVMGGKHAWVLNGFVARADPAKTNEFEVLELYVTAPGYGLISYDSGIPYNTKLSLEQFKNFLTRYGKHSYLKPYTEGEKTLYEKNYYNSIWTGFYVTIQPVQ